MNPGETARCRPPRSNWLLLVLPAAYGPMALAAASSPSPKGPPSPGETAFFLILSVFCLFTGLGIAWWMCRACITADADGLRRRGFGGWKCVRWNEVSDFYDKLPPRSSGRATTTACVVEAAGRKIHFSCDWSNAETLRALVARNAVSSRVPVWEIKGTRLVDPWPRVFDYNTRENRWAPRLWLKLFGVFVVYVVIQPALKLAAAAALLGWTAALAITALYLLLMGSLGLVFLVPLAQYRAANKRKAERITADVGGLVFESEARRLAAAWVDVTCYKLVSHGLLFRYVVETRQGQFDFLPSLGGVRLLQAIIQRSATHAENTEWRLPADREALGGEAACWSGGKVGIGTRFYHYRTRGYRAVLLGMTFLGGVCGLLFAAMKAGCLPGALPPSPAGTVFAAVFWVAALLLGLRAYLWNGIALDDRGLTQRTLLGSRYLAWEQVQEYAVRPLGGGKVRGRRTTIEFSSDIVGSAELNEEIGRRAADLMAQRTKTAKLSS